MKAPKTVWMVVDRNGPVAPFKTKGEATRTASEWDQLVSSYFQINAPHTVVAYDKRKAKR